MCSQVQFQDVPEGQVFEVNGRIFVKTKSVVGYNAQSFNNKAYYHFNKDYVVMWHVGVRPQPVVLVLV